MGKKTCLKRKTVSHTSYFKCCITLNICLCSCLLGEAYFNTVLCLLFPISSSHAIWVIARSSYLHEHPAKQKASCVLEELAACICFSSYKGICVPHSLMKLRKSREDTQPPHLLLSNMLLGATCRQNKRKHHISWVLLCISPTPHSLSISIFLCAY